MLTERGKGLLPVILGLLDWGDEHLAPNGPPALVRHAGCGGPVEAGSRLRAVRGDRRRG